MSNLSLDSVYALEVSALKKHFLQGENTIEVLRGIDFSLNAGELVALVGQSGSGKTTLLQMLGLLDRPSSGSIRIGGHYAADLSDDERSKLRCKYLGFVFQFHHLLPEFSALENLIIPQMMLGTVRAKAESKAKELLADLGLEHRLHHRPAELSGGEQQRVAIGRALINDPSVLLADEPTGNLDTDTSEQVLQVLLKMTKERSVAALIVTHNPHIAVRMNRTLYMKDGRLST
jgi:lipoprotein-releasing system ATP-binding protein